ncbi:hypothetical protein [Legionella hackeliae]|uniref:Transmembrane protein n=1 Tax=Legionella hackeliae TaxID=449 RepID=A0A0A8UT42_LEGHA|nr:hypothetical protein [Legionella hackeliae]KTD12609.1 hypothetical protein Lhac_1480 [Legionella hackeliae]CEK12025.1 conserved membrane protein of unknown function [Legionella hackeliae]STX48809.1 Uncharacterised protein [Legionella hackeliae]
MKAKKIPYYLLLILLTMGASLILGFLSFGGMFVLSPALSLALGSFVLSVAYEGEIYLQNIKGALNKLFFKREYLKHHLANEYLLTHFPNTADENCPEFFKDYEKQLKLLHLFAHKKLDKQSLADKQRIEKTLRNMEKWFAQQLSGQVSNQTLSDSETTTVNIYENQLKQWLSNHDQEEWQTKLKERRAHFNKVKLFSLLASIFMGFGTTYLLVEAFAAIPLLAAISMTALPFLIVPMAIIAGAAYGFLTYNAVTDMINNDTIRKWYNKIRHNLSEGLTVRSVFIATVAILLVGLAVALTVCTAGTWWTVVKHTRPIFTWMEKIPSFVMGVIHPVVTGMSSLVFNLQNTSESLDIIDKATQVKHGFLKRFGKSIVEGWQNLKARENWLQIVNPARILLKLTVTPLRIVFFLGHLISIGVTADRVPGVPEIVSALLGIISEGFEDAHYFFDHSHDGHQHHHDDEHHHHHSDSHEVEMQDIHQHTNKPSKQTKALLKERLSAGHGHDHSVDIPTRVIKGFFFLFYIAAAKWDSWASQRNEGTFRHVLDYKQAREKQMGEKEISHVNLKGVEQPSANWKAHHAIYRIDRFKEKHLGKVVWQQGIAHEKLDALNTLQNDLRNGKSVVERLEEEKGNHVHYKQRFFDRPDSKTKTSKFIDELPTQISSPAA